MCKRPEPPSLYMRVNILVRVAVDFSRKPFAILRKNRKPSIYYGQPYPRRRAPVYQAKCGRDMGKSDIIYIYICPGPRAISGNFSRAVLGG